jgi:methyl-accepting chemotaxis protein
MATKIVLNLSDGFQWEGQLKDSVIGPLSQQMLLLSEEVKKRQALLAVDNPSLSEEEVSALAETELFKELLEKNPPDLVKLFRNVFWIAFGDLCHRFVRQGEDDLPSLITLDFTELGEILSSLTTAISEFSTTATESLEAANPKPEADKKTTKGFPKKLKTPAMSSKAVKAEVVADDEPEDEMTALRAELAALKSRLALPTADPVIEPEAV